MRKLYFKNGTSIRISESGEDMPHGGLWKAILYNWTGNEDPNEIDRVAGLVDKKLVADIEEYSRQLNALTEGLRGLANYRSWPDALISSHYVADRAKAILRAMNSESND